MNVLFVCTGNTCRSPMAEGLMQSIWAEAGYNGCVLSAGLAAISGMPVTDKSVRAVAEKVDISNHTARLVNRELLEASDVVITMTQNHKNYIMEQWPEVKERVYTLAELAGEATDIVDPFGQNQEIYNLCAKEIEKMLKKAWKNMQNMS